MRCSDGAGDGHALDPVGARLAVTGGVGYFKNRTALATAISSRSAQMSSVSAGFGTGSTARKLAPGRAFSSPGSKAGRPGVDFSVAPGRLITQFGVSAPLAGSGGPRRRRCAGHALARRSRGPLRQRRTSLLSGEVGVGRRAARFDHGMGEAAVEQALPEALPRSRSAVRTTMRRSAGAGLGQRRGRERKRKAAG